MKVLVTGAAGMLGTDLCEALRPGHSVVPIDLPDLDLTDTARTRDFVRRTAPDFVCHAAAWTDVDGCEREPDRAFRHNGLATWNVAAACAEAGCPLLYVSTDFVFDGETDRPYTEYDPPHPLGVYGASKLAGETHVRALVPRHLIARTAWLYGAHGQNFVRTILRLADEKEELPVVADQIGSPTYTRDLAAALVSLLDDPLWGAYHVTNSGACSWAEFAQEILRLAGKEARIRPLRSDEWPSPTRRPKMSVLRNYALELQGRPLLRPWREALRAFLLEIQALSPAPSE
jgi:dTDP-4-dehydrorhamnose reductase